MPSRTVDWCPSLLAGTFWLQVCRMETHENLCIFVQAQSSSGNYAGRILGNSGRQPSQAWGQNRQRRGMYILALSFDM